MAPHSSTLAWKIHERRSLVGCSPWGPWVRHKWASSLSLFTFMKWKWHFQGNGNPLRCSCLENPRDGEVWWAAVYGVAQSQTRLKRLSSSSRLHNTFYCAPSIVHPSSSLSWNSSMSSISRHKTPLLYSTNGFLKMFFKICWVGKYSSTISYIAFFKNPSTISHIAFSFLLNSSLLTEICT